MNQRLTNNRLAIPDDSEALVDFVHQLASENETLREQLRGQKHSETSEHYSEASYRSIFENASEGKYQCTPDGRFLKINRSLARIYGFDSVELLLQNEGLKKNRYGGELNVQNEFESLLAEQGEVVGFEYEIKRNDGLLLWVSENARVIKDSKGKIIHYEGTIQDISERKHVEQVVHENEQRLRRQNRSLVHLTRRRSITHENLNQTLREVISAATMTLNVERGSIWLFNDDRSQLKCACLFQKAFDQYSQGMLLLADDYPGYFAALRQERIVSAPCAQTDPRLTDLIADYLQPNNIQSVLTAPIKGGDEFIGVVKLEHVGQPRVWTLDEQNFTGSIADVASLAIESAERQRMEEALRVTEERFQILVRATNESIYDWDFTKDRIWWNEGLKSLFGFKAEDMRQDSGWRFSNIHPEDQERVENEINYIVDEGGQFWSGEYRHRRSDGSYAYVIDRGFILQDRTGQPIRMIGSIMDITARKMAEQTLKEERAHLARRVEERTVELSGANAALAKASKLKDEFLASMSHELRTPLNAILGMSEALVEQVYGPLNEKQQRFIRNIDESGRHLLSLINDILDLSKIEVGKLELQLDSVSLETVCHASVRMVKEVAHRKRIDIVLDVESDLPEIIADERRLKQILVNLLSNAVKFTPDGGKVGLQIERSSGDASVICSVWDSGIGISQENLGRLFQPFTQLDSRLSRQYNGTGLGLALVRRMVEMHGGTVRVQSAPGQGSRFTFNIPMQMDYVSPNDPDALNPININFTHPGMVECVDEPVPLAPVQASQSNALILLAEDNEMNIESIAGYLQIKGFRLVIARNGLEAVQAARAEVPDVVLMDVQMPEMDGLEATKQLRARGETSNVPIIALTALAMPGDKERCLAAGVNFYISKPVNLKNLVMTINQIIQKAAID